MKISGKDANGMHEWDYRNDEDFPSGSLAMRVLAIACVVLFVLANLAMLPWCLFFRGGTR